MHGRPAIIIYVRRSFSRSRVLARAAGATPASNLLRAITHGSVPEISRSPPRFAFNFVPVSYLRRAARVSARLSLEGDIHFIKRACAGHRDVRGKKRGGKNKGKTERKEEENLSACGISLFLRGT